MEVRSLEERRGGGRRDADTNDLRPLLPGRCPKEAVLEEERRKKMGGGRSGGGRGGKVRRMEDNAISPRRSFSFVTSFLNADATPEGVAAAAGGMKEKDDGNG